MSTPVGPDQTSNDESSTARSPSTAGGADRPRYADAEIQGREPSRSGSPAAPAQGSETASAQYREPDSSGDSVADSSRTERVHTEKVAAQPQVQPVRVHPDQVQTEQVQAGRARTERLESMPTNAGEVAAGRARPDRTVAAEPLPQHRTETRTVQDPQLRDAGLAASVPTRETVLARERDEFGGMKIGSAFFGWLTATGLAVLLLAILAAAGVAFGIASTATVDQAVQQSQNGTGTAKTVGLVGAIVLLVILFVAYYCGGYVAGRMARFSGAKQGLAVWLWAIVTAGIIAALAAVAGSKYNVLSQLNLPRIPVDEGSLTTVGIISIVAAVLVALLGALLGGVVGTRYHRKVDAVGFADAERTTDSYEGPTARAVR